MQISRVTEKELGLLITGLRAIHISDSVDEKRRLLIQLETELATRFGKRIGSEDEQERYKAID